MKKSPYERWEAGELLICEMKPIELKDFNAEVSLQEKYNYNRKDIKILSHKQN